MKIDEIIKALDSEPDYTGLELTKVNGILTSTWLLYKKGDFYYYFYIDEEIEFVDEYKYSKEELVETFGRYNYTIDLFIN